jgi:hypothetical protein
LKKDGASSLSDAHRSQSVSSGSVSAEWCMMASAMGWDCPKAFELAEAKSGLRIQSGQMKSPDPDSKNSEASEAGQTPAPAPKPGSVHPRRGSPWRTNDSRVGYSSRRGRRAWVDSRVDCGAYALTVGFLETYTVRTAFSRWLLCGKEDRRSDTGKDTGGGRTSACP